MLHKMHRPQTLAIALFLMTAPSVDSYAGIVSKVLGDFGCPGLGAAMQLVSMGRGIEQLNKYSPESWKVDGMVAVRDFKEFVELASEQPPPTYYENLPKLFKIFAPGSKIFVVDPVKVRIEASQVNKNDVVLLNSLKEIERALQPGGSGALIVSSDGKVQFISKEIYSWAIQASLIMNEPGSRQKLKP